MLARYPAPLETSSRFYTSARIPARTVYVLADAENARPGV